MKREDISKLFPDATDEQISALKDKAHRSMSEAGDLKASSETRIDF